MKKIIVAALILISCACLPLPALATAWTGAFDCTAGDPCSGTDTCAFTDTDTVTGNTTFSNGCAITTPATLSTVTVSPSVSITLSGTANTWTSGGTSKATWTNFVGTVEGSPTWLGIYLLSVADPTTVSWLHLKDCGGVKGCFEVGNDTTSAVTLQSIFVENGTNILTIEDCSAGKDLTLDNFVYTYLDANTGWFPIRTEACQYVFSDFYAYHRTMQDTIEGVLRASGSSAFALDMQRFYLGSGISLWTSLDGMIVKNGMISNRNTANTIIGLTQGAYDGLWLRGIGGSGTTDVFSISAGTGAVSLSYSIVEGGGAANEAGVRINAAGVDFTMDHVALRGNATAAVTNYDSDLGNSCPDVSGSALAQWDADACNSLSITNAETSTTFLLDIENLSEASATNSTLTWTFDSATPNSGDDTVAFPGFGFCEYGTTSGVVLGETPLCNCNPESDEWCGYYWAQMGTGLIPNQAISGHSATASGLASGTPFYYICGIMDGECGKHYDDAGWSAATFDTTAAASTGGGATNGAFLDNWLDSNVLH